MILVKSAFWLDSFKNKISLGEIVVLMSTTVSQTFINMDEKCKFFIYGLFLDESTFFPITPYM